MSTEDVESDEDFLERICARRPPRSDPRAVELVHLDSRGRDRQVEGVGPGLGRVTSSERSHLPAGQALAATVH